MSLTKATYSMVEGTSANVQDYGAVGDGLTNDRSAIQSALDTGNSVFFPAGKVFRVDGTLAATANGQIINLNGSMVDFRGSANVRYRLYLQA